MAKKATSKPKRTVKTTQVTNAVTPEFNVNAFNLWYEQFQEALRSKGMRNGDINAINPESKHSEFKAGLTPQQAAD